MTMLALGRMLSAGSAARPPAGLFFATSGGSAERRLRPRRLIVILVPGGGPATFRDSTKETPEKSSGKVALYESPDDEVRLDVQLEREAIWFTQKQMAELFDTSTDNIGLHLKNVYAAGELAEEATAEDSSVVQREGSRRVRRNVKHYNLDAVISVGYRVNSARGMQV